MVVKSKIRSAEGFEGMHDEENVTVLETEDSALVKE
jgi:hypothetical protein